MRLINIRTLELEEFFGGRIPRYLILSHTWEDEEISFQDYNWILEFQQNLGDGIIDEFGPKQRFRVQTKFDALKNRTGYSKIQGLVSLARGFQSGIDDSSDPSLAQILRYQAEPIDYVWIDTCCINKESSAELSEAINSMYEWYNRAVFCITYLGDVSSEPLPNDLDLSTQEMRARSDLPNSRWFTRGWTLQELLVPPYVFFYDRHWRYITSRGGICVLLEEITGISREFLTGVSPRSSCSVATKMSWAARRQTTRVEDEAYCLLGLFGVNMPLLYGEGARAFQRLQHEIMRTSDDQSIFLWGYDQPIETLTAPTTFAPSPRPFRRSAGVLPTIWALVSFTKKPFFLTNIGLHISFNLIRTPTGTFAVLPFTDDRGWLLGIPLEGLDHVTTLKSVEDGTAIARRNSHQPMALLEANSHNIGSLILKTLTLVDSGVLTPHHIRTNNPGTRPTEFTLVFTYDASINIIEHYCPELRTKRYGFDGRRRSLILEGFLRQTSFRTKSRPGPWATIYFRVRKASGPRQSSEEFVVKLDLDDAKGSLWLAKTTSWDTFRTPSMAPSMAALFLAGGVQAGRMEMPVEGWHVAVRRGDVNEHLNHVTSAVNGGVTLRVSLSEI